MTRKRNAYMETTELLDNVTRLGPGVTTLNTQMRARPEPHTHFLLNIAGNITNDPASPGAQDITFADVLQSIDLTMRRGSRPLINGVRLADLVALCLLRQDNDPIWPANVNGVIAPALAAGANTNVNMTFNFPFSDRRLKKESDGWVMPAQWTGSVNCTAVNRFPIATAAGNTLTWTAGQAFTVQIFGVSVVNGSPQAGVVRTIDPAEDNSGDRILNSGFIQECYFSATNTAGAYDLYVDGVQVRDDLQPLIGINQTVHEGGFNALASKINSIANGNTLTSLWYDFTGATAGSDGCIPIFGAKRDTSLLRFTQPHTYRIRWLAAPPAAGFRYVTERVEPHDATMVAAALGVLPPGGGGVNFATLQAAGIGANSANKATASKARSTADQQVLPQATATTSASMISEQGRNNA